MQKKVAISQSNYIPWKGYFDMIASVDEFILYDDMQYTRRDWRNRNQIKTLQGRKWLTVPVQVKGKYHQKIRETKIADDNWATSHWQMLEQNYLHAPYYKEIAEWLKPLFMETSITYLSTLNRTFICAICSYLEIGTIISNSCDYQLTEGKSERLADLCLLAGGTEYVSGPSAKDYIEEEVFTQKNIKFTWFDYDNYPEYPQLYGEFTHSVTILDLIFNCGKESKNYMRYIK